MNNLAEAIREYVEAAMEYRLQSIEDPTHEWSSALELKNKMDRAFAKLAACAERMKKQA